MDNELSSNHNIGIRKLFFWFCHFEPNLWVKQNQYSCTEKTYVKVEDRCFKTFILHKCAFLHTSMDIYFQNALNIFIERGVENEITREREKCRIYL